MVNFGENSKRIKADRKTAKQALNSEVSLNLRPPWIVYIIHLRGVFCSFPEGEPHVHMGEPSMLTTHQGRTNESRQIQIFFLSAFEHIFFKIFASGREEKGGGGGGGGLFCEGGAAAKKHSKKKFDSKVLNSAK